MAVLFVVLILLGHIVGQSRSQCPSVCACLQENQRLRCSDSGATDFPNFPADIRQTAIFIEFQGNSITSIQASDLQGFVNLETLDLSLNQITAIEEGSFTSNTALSTLDLSSNGLSELPDNLFNSTSIITLDLQRNNFSSLSASIFTGVLDGAAIHLDANQLEMLSQETFISLDLHELSLSGNPIKCDCLLRWFPAYRSTITATTNLGTCTQPANVAGENLQLITEDQLLCDCTPSCVNGTCNTTVGECECDDGYIGTSCDTPCPVGSFGPGCARSCSCLSEREASPCNPVDGSCNCLPGYTGSSCEEACPDMTFGTDCLEICSCVEGRVGSPSCDNVNGDCICLPGYSGDSCEKEEESTEALDDGFPIFGSVLVAIFGAIMLVAIVLVVALVYAWVKRKRTNDETNANEEPGDD